MLTLQALRHLRNIQVINFGDCLVRSEGAIALAAVLTEGLPVLKVSETSGSSVPEPFMVLHGALVCLQELNLSFGEITAGAALVVAQAVLDKPHMEKVNLNGTSTHQWTALPVAMPHGNILDRTYLCLHIYDYKAFKFVWNRTG